MAGWPDAVQPDVPRQGDRVGAIEICVGAAFVIGEQKAAADFRVIARHRVVERQSAATPIGLRLFGETCQESTRSIDRHAGGIVDSNRERGLRSCCGLG